MYENGIILQKEKRMPDNSTVSVRMSNELIDHLKQKARELSAEQHKNISFSKLIREAAEKEYPIPKRRK